MIRKRKADGRIDPVNVLERLMQHAGATDDECWEHPGSSSEAGHVRIRLDDKSRMMVHRLAWEAHYAEPIPEGMFVRHKCDNPCCFNPHHLELGTTQDNVDDKMRRGRHKCPQKTTAEERAVIANSIEPTSVLAKRYGITTARVRQIRK